jgi:ribose transport system ATP-binding protein
MIYQELALAPHLDVESNVMLGLEEHRWGFLRRRQHEKRVREALALLAHSEIRLSTPVRQLSPGACQLVEVARALVSDARIIVFDEPTSSLTRHDTEHLFALIGRLQVRGVSILYISHFLEEVQCIASRFTVLRDGQTAGTGAVADTSTEQIIQWMVGRNLGDLFPRVPHTLGAPVMEVQQLAGDPLPATVDLTLHQGEILGLFGLVGAGRTELLRTLFGLDAATAGNVRFRGENVTWNSVTERIHRGMGLLSEDRKGEGLALIQSIADNLTYSRLRPYLRGWLLDLRRRRAAVLTWLERLQVRCRGPEQRVGDLSGGNQQKVVLARLLHQEAEVLLLDEPTRGVDVGSKAEIYRLIGQLAAAGKAVLFVSSYLPELLGVCDTLAVMSRGRLSAVRLVAEWTEEQILALATGGSGE